MQKSFHFSRRIGVPRQVGDIEITPESLVLLAQVGNWGYVWNWPVAVTVTRSQVGIPGGSFSEGSRVERHAIVDITRLLLWSMRAVTLLMLMIAVFGPFFFRSRKRKPQ
jgi:hypothetical protein